MSTLLAWIIFEMTNHKTNLTEKIGAVIAKESNGNIQITFTIPFEQIKKAQKDVILEKAAEIEIPGFRKGKAPLDKVAEKISEAELVEHSLRHILPMALADAIEQNKLKIAIYPKFELISSKIDEPWQIRAITCELPEVKLGDYKKTLSGALRASKLWTPDKAGETSEPKKEDKENLIIKTMLETVKIDIPQILIEEEANNRISGLLSRLEKLGLALESYLTSINKKADDLRADYANQAREAISLDLILSKIAAEEDIKADEKELEAALGVSAATRAPTDNEDPESRKRLLESILKRRKALDYLVNLT